MKYKKTVLFLAVLLSTVVLISAYESPHTWNISPKYILDVISGGGFLVEKEEIVDVYALKVLSEAPPEFMIVGDIAPVYAFDDSKNEYLYSVKHILKDHKENTSIEVVFYWSPSNTNTGNVTWCVDRHPSIANNNETITNGNVISCITDYAEGLQYELLKSERLEIPYNISTDGIVSFRIYRDVDNNDNYTGDAYLVQGAYYYQSDKIGDKI